MLLAIVLVVLALSLWSLVQAERLRPVRAVLSMAVAMAAIGVWLIVACGVESLDVGYGYVASGGPLPTLIVASRPQLVGAALVWGASMLVAGVVGRHLTRRSTRTTD
ncbi:hypothetical protein AERO_05180 [Aeromicrobium fastidiosum]|uniref:hypothetical protein n=1 Tax=Aeromicrobium fastidiosum TaxID=52699 RepID=UPI002023266E|nr:hypothetical protein [Aeromicrobium fastidiosum]MCL8250771.1 hypothetical protein [Aeromicrobium fastidiosum]